MPLIPTLKDLIFLMWSADGWIAGRLEILLQGECGVVHCTSVRMENREEVEEVLDRIRPTNMLNCAGCTGHPNVDWCEDNKEQTIRSNAIGTLNLADRCYLRGIRLTVLRLVGMHYDTEHRPVIDLS